MFEDFTDRARRVVVHAHREAYAHHNDYIGTEHLLLGLIHDSGDAVVETLRVVGIGPEAIRRHLEQTIGAAPTPPLRAPAVHPTGQERAAAQPA